MKLSDVIALIGAGYSKEEIEAFEAMETGTPVKAEEKPVEKPVQDEVKPEIKGETAPQNTDELLDAIKGLTKALQVSNVRNKPQPAESAADNVEEKADKALMEIYNL